MECIDNTGRQAPNEIGAVAHGMATPSNVEHHFRALVEQNPALAEKIITLANRLSDGNPDKKFGFVSGALVAVTLLRRERETAALQHLLLGDAPPQPTQHNTAA